MNQKPLNALLIGTSGGIGQALAEALARDDSFHHVDALSRSDDGLDFRHPGTIAEAANKLTIPDSGYDLIFNLAGALEINGKRPEKSFAELDPKNMMAAYQINTIGPALFIQEFGKHLAKDRRAVFAHLSARVGSIGDNKLGGWMSYRASKAALNQIIRCASIELKRSHPQAICVALHPGTVETNLTRKYAKGRYTATPDGAAAQLLGVINALTPQDTGGFFDYKGEQIIW